MQQLKLKLKSVYKGIDLKTDEEGIGYLIDHGILRGSEDKDTLIRRVCALPDDKVILLFCLGTRYGTKKASYVVVQEDGAGNVTGVLAYDKFEEAKEFFQEI